MTRLQALKRANATVQRRVRRDRERDRGDLTWAQRNWLAIKADPKLHEAYKANRREYVARSRIRAKQWAELKANPAKHATWLQTRNANRKQRVARMSDDERKAVLKRARETRKARGDDKRRWQEMKADPELMAKHREQQQRARDKARLIPERVEKQRGYDKAYQQRKRQKLEAA